MKLAVFCIALVCVSEVNANPRKACSDILSALSSRPIKVSVRRDSLEMGRGFLSASGTIKSQPRLFVRVEDSNGNVGYGEEAPHPRTGPSLESLEWAVRSAKSLHETNSLQLAGLYVESRRTGKPIHQLLELPTPSPELKTVVTYGTENLQKTITEIESEKPAAIKLKLNGLPGELETVEAIASRFEQPLVLDINTNWTPANVEANLERLKPLADRILWIEQPLPPLQMRKLSGPFKFFADEAVAANLADGNLYDGVVLKPAIYGMERTLEYALRSHQEGMEVTFGCHLQSCITTGASVQMAGLVDGVWVDLDSAVLVRKDPFELDGNGVAVPK